MSVLLNWRVWAAILVAVALAASHWKVYKLGGAELRAEWNAEKLETSQQTLRLLESRDRDTTALQTGADTLRRNKNAQIARLDADLAAALDGLHNRPARPGASDLPADSGAGPVTGCTGASLYRPDAEFLVRQAARADRFLADLQQCQAAYGEARAAINGR